MDKMNGKLKVWLVATLCVALVAFSLPFITSTYKADSDKPVVILLDPGHGGPDFGACNTPAGMYESNMNLVIAKACYNELLRYDGVEVYMTHEGLDPKGKKMTLTERTKMAKTLNADILISLHTNDAKNANANGAEVFVSHSTYKAEYKEKSSELALCILKNIKPLGFNIRGVLTRLSNGSRMYHHADGSEEVGDYYAVIGQTIKNYGIPGILVEHGFIKGDKELMDSEEELVALGVADATGIAQYYGLTLKENAGESFTTLPEEGVYLTDAQRQEVTDAKEYILGLPNQINAEDEFNVVKAQELFDALNEDQKSILDEDIYELLYQSMLQVEYLHYPVRLETANDELLFINRFDKSVTGFTADFDGITVDEVLSEFEINFDMNALLSNERLVAEEQLISEYEQAGFEGVTPVDAEIEQRAQDNVNNYLLTSDFGIIMTDKNGEVITGDETVGTGCLIKVMADGEAVDTITVVVAGDISGDGLVDSLDNLRLARHLKGVEELSSSDLLAADVNCDGEINDEDTVALMEQIAA